MTFKEKIVKLRKLKGLTQDEFASAVGVSRQAVYKWESGQSYPEVAKLLEIKLLFNISIDDLLDENYEVIVPERKKRKRLPKEVRAEIEKEVLGGGAAEEITAEPAAAEALEAEPVAEPVAAGEEIKEESAAVPEAQTVSDEFPSESLDTDEEPKKKVGFFGRIFGRK